MSAREAATELMARALASWNGLTWDEARSVGADGESEAQVYASMADEALSALLEAPELLVQVGVEEGVLQQVGWLAPTTTRKFGYVLNVEPIEAPDEGPVFRCVVPINPDSGVTP